MSAQPSKEEITNNDSPPATSAHLFDEVVYVDKVNVVPDHPSIPTTITKSSHIKASRNMDVIRSLQIAHQIDPESTYNDTTLYILGGKGETPPLQSSVQGLQSLNVQEGRQLQSQRAQSIKLTNSPSDHNDSSHALVITGDFTHSNGSQSGQDHFAPSSSSSSTTQRLPHSSTEVSHMCVADSQITRSQPTAEAHNVTQLLSPNHLPSTIHSSSPLTSPHSQHPHDLYTQLASSLSTQDLSSLSPLAASSSFLSSISHTLPPVDKPKYEPFKHNPAQASPSRAVERNTQGEDPNPDFNQPPFLPQDLPSTTHPASNLQFHPDPTTNQQDMLTEEHLGTQSPQLTDYSKLNIHQSPPHSTAQRTTPLQTRDYQHSPQYPQQHPQTPVFKIFYPSPWLLLPRRSTSFPTYHPPVISFRCSLTGLSHSNPPPTFPVSLRRESESIPVRSSLHPQLTGFLNLSVPIPSNVLAVCSDLQAHTTLIATQPNDQPALSVSLPFPQYNSIIRAEMYPRVEIKTNTFSMRCQIPHTSLSHTNSSKFHMDGETPHDNLNTAEATVKNDNFIKYGQSNPPLSSQSPKSTQNPPQDVIKSNHRSNQTIPSSSSQPSQSSRSSTSSTNTLSLSEQFSAHFSNQILGTPHATTIQPPLYSPTANFNNPTADQSNNSTISINDISSHSPPTQHTSLILQNHSTDLDAGDSQKSNHSSTTHDPHSQISQSDLTIQSSTQSAFSSHSAQLSIDETHTHDATTTDHDKQNPQTSTPTTNQSRKSTPDVSQNQEKAESSTSASENSEDDSSILPKDIHDLRMNEVVTPRDAISTAFSPQMGVWYCPPPLALAGTFQSPSDQEFNQNTPTNHNPSSPTAAPNHHNAFHRIPPQPCHFLSLIHSPFVRNANNDIPDGSLHLQQDLGEDMIILLDSFNSLLLIALPQYEVFLSQTLDRIADCRVALQVASHQAQYLSQRMEQTSQSQQQQHNQHNSHNNNFHPPHQHHNAGQLMNNDQMSQFYPDQETNLMGGDYAEHFRQNSTTRSISPSTRKNSTEEEYGPPSCINSQPHDGRSDEHLDAVDNQTRPHPHPHPHNDRHFHPDDDKSSHQPAFESPQIDSNPTTPSLPPSPSINNSDTDSATQLQLQSNITNSRAYTTSVLPPIHTSTPSIHQTIATAGFPGGYSGTQGNLTPAMDPTSIHQLSAYHFSISGNLVLLHKLIMTLFTFCATQGVVCLDLSCIHGLAKLPMNSHILLLTLLPSPLSPILLRLPNSKQPPGQLPALTEVGRTVTVGYKEDNIIVPVHTCPITLQLAFPIRLKKHNTAVMNILETTHKQRTMIKQLQNKQICQSIGCPHSTTAADKSSQSLGTQQQGQFGSQRSNTASVANNAQTGVNNNNNNNVNACGNNIPGTPNTRSASHSLSSTPHTSIRKNSNPAEESQIVVDDIPHDSPTNNNHTSPQLSTSVHSQPQNAPNSPAPKNRHQNGNHTASPQLSSNDNRDSSDDHCPPSHCPSHSTNETSAIQQLSNDLNPHAQSQNLHIPCPIHSPDAQPQPQLPPTSLWFNPTTTPAQCNTNTSNNNALSTPPSSSTSPSVFSSILSRQNIDKQLNLPTENAVSPCDIFIKAIQLLQPTVTLLPSLLDRTPVWLPDDTSTACMLCEKAFSFLNRKHHCRACGTLVCGKCSTHTAVLPDLGYPKGVRVCDNCYEAISGFRLGVNMLKSLDQHAAAASAQQTRDQTATPAATTTGLGMNANGNGNGSLGHTGVSDITQNQPHNQSGSTLHQNGPSQSPSLSTGSSIHTSGISSPQSLSSSTPTHSLTFRHPAHLMVADDSSHGGNRDKVEIYSNPRFALPSKSGSNSIFDVPSQHHTHHTPSTPPSSRSDLDSPTESRKSKRDKKSREDFLRSLSTLHENPFFDPTTHYTDSDSDSTSTQPNDVEIAGRVGSSDLSSLSEIDVDLSSAIALPDQAVQNHNRARDGHNNTDLPTASSQTQHLSQTSSRDARSASLHVYSDLSTSQQTTQTPLPLSEASYHKRSSLPSLAHSGSSHLHTGHGATVVSRTEVPAIPTAILSTTHASHSPNDSAPLDSDENCQNVRGYIKMGDVVLGKVFSEKSVKTTDIEVGSGPLTDDLLNASSPHAMSHNGQLNGRKASAETLPREMFASHAAVSAVSGSLTDEIDSISETNDDNTENPSPSTPPPNNNQSKNGMNMTSLQLTQSQTDSSRPGAAYKTTDRIISHHAASPNAKLNPSRGGGQNQHGTNNLGDYVQCDVLINSDAITMGDLNPNHVPIPPAPTRPSSTTNSSPNHSGTNLGLSPSSHTDFDETSLDPKILEQRAVAIELNKLTLKFPKIVSYYDYYGFQTQLPQTLIETINRALQDTQTRALHEINKKNRLGVLTLDEIAKVRLELSTKHQLAQEFAQKRATRLELAQYAQMDTRWKDIFCELPWIDRANPKLREGTSLGIPPNVRVYLWKTLMEYNILQQHYDSLCLKQLDEIQLLQRQSEWERLVGLEQQLLLQAQLANQTQTHIVGSHPHETGQIAQITANQAQSSQMNANSTGFVFELDQNEHSLDSDSEDDDQRVHALLDNPEAVQLHQQRDQQKNHDNRNSPSFQSPLDLTDLPHDAAPSTASIAFTLSAHDPKRHQKDSLDQELHGLVATPLAHSPLLSHITPHAKLYYRKQLQKEEEDTNTAAASDLFDLQAVPSQPNHRSNRAQSSLAQQLSQNVNAGGHTNNKAVSSPRSQNNMDDIDHTTLSPASSNHNGSQPHGPSQQPHTGQSAIAGQPANRDRTSSCPDQSQSQSQSQSQQFNQHDAANQSTSRHRDDRSRTDKIKKSYPWIEEAIKHVKNPLSHYANLLGNLADRCRWVKDIEKDINRTLPTNKHLNRDALRRVLAAYSVHNRRVGYCQSMNHIAASMLLVLHDEEDAFWATTCIVEGILHMKLVESTMTTMMENGMTQDEAQNAIIQPLQDDPQLNSALAAYPQTKQEYDQQESYENGKKDKGKISFNTNTNTNTSTNTSTNFNSSASAHANSGQSSSIGSTLTQFFQKNSFSTHTPSTSGTFVNHVHHQPVAGAPVSNQNPSPTGQFPNHHATTTTTTTPTPTSSHDYPVFSKSHSNMGLAEAPLTPSRNTHVSQPYSNYQKRQQEQYQQHQQELREQYLQQIGQLSTQQSQHAQQSQNGQGDGNDHSRSNNLNAEFDLTPSSSFHTPSQYPPTDSNSQSLTLSTPTAIAGQAQFNTNTKPIKFNTNINLNSSTSNGFDRTQQTNTFFSSRNTPQQQSSILPRHVRLPPAHQKPVHLLYHQEDLMGARVDTAALSLLVETKLPRVFKVLKTFSIEPQTITFAWFLSFFQEIVPLPIGFVIIDWLLLDGCRSLFRLALILLRLREPQLLAAKHPGDIMMAMSAKILDVMELNRLMCEFSVFSNISTNMLQTLRQQVYEDLIAKSKSPAPNFASKKQKTNQTSLVKQNSHNFATQPLQSSNLTKSTATFNTVAPAINNPHQGDNQNQNTITTLSPTPSNHQPASTSPVYQQHRLTQEFNTVPGLLMHNRPQ